MGKGCEIHWHETSLLLRLRLVHCKCIFHETEAIGLLAVLLCDHFLDGSVACMRKSCTRAVFSTPRNCRLFFKRLGYLSVVHLLPKIRIIVLLVTSSLHRIVGDFFPREFYCDMHNDAGLTRRPGAFFIGLLSFTTYDTFRVLIPENYRRVHRQSKKICSKPPLSENHFVH